MARRASLPTVKRIRSILGPIARRVTRTSNRLTPELLRLRLGRHGLNVLYERAGPFGAGLVNRLSAGARPRNDFVWRTRIGEANLLLPVTADLRRSWSDALLWRSPPVLPMRAFCERYLADRRAIASGGETLVLFDVGANDGMMTYPFAAYGWRCTSFEPQEGCIRHIGAVCRLNGFDDVTPVQCVVTSVESAGVDFFVSESSWYSSLSREQVEQFEPSHRVQLPAITLDGFLQDDQPPPTCVKIDVEGAEDEVLEGARRTLERDRPDLIVEVLSDRQLRNRVWDLLQPLGYRFYVVTQSRRWPLRRIDHLEDFVAAESDHDHGDFVMFADPRLIARAEPWLKREPV